MADGAPIPEQFWTPQKVASFKAAFLDFLKAVRIDSKETGGESEIVPYRSQLMLVDKICEGLLNGKHDNTILKSRQLGISTFVWLLVIFFISTFRGVQGAMVFDNESNRDKFHQLINRAIDSLPKSHKISFTRNSIRGGITLSNGSALDYLVAGVKKTKASGGLGRGKGISLLHSTEISSWGDEEGLRSLEESLAEDNPLRLFLWESTARGHNIFYDRWEEAKKDPYKNAIFIGWWAHDRHFIPRSHPAFQLYGAKPPTQEEAKKIAEVKERYGWDITDEQLAWVRRKMDPKREKEEGDPESETDEIRRQEQPWTEEDAFIDTGSNFYPVQRIGSTILEAKKLRFQGYRYFLGEDFFGMACEEATRLRDVTLKIWEQPQEGAVYAIGADPAYGSSDDADAYCANVLRLYGDGADQVAEFRDVSLQPYQFAWVLVHLCAVYSNCRFLLEINGPGNSVWVEMRNLKKTIEQGYLKDEAEERGIKNIFKNVRNYIWTRPDIVSGSSNAYHWKTNDQNKFEIYTQAKDEYLKGGLLIRSVECLNELRYLRQEGIQVHGEGKRKDDRATALALSVRAWNDFERRGLITRGVTRETEKKRPDWTHADLMQMHQKNIVQDFFRKQQGRRRVSNYGKWRSTGWKW